MSVMTRATRARSLNSDPVAPVASSERNQPPLRVVIARTVRTFGASGNVATMALRGKSAIRS
jgi:hypothetical protein